MDKNKIHWPGIAAIAKSLWSGGSPFVQDISPDMYRGGGLQAPIAGQEIFYEFVTASHSFGRTNLKFLVETGYVQNPAVFGMINRILNAQRNIKFIPWWNDGPWKSKKWTLDIAYAELMLLTTGTIFFYKRRIAGFADEVTVLNTLDITETYTLGKYYYDLDLHDGRYERLNNDDLLMLKFEDISGYWHTNMGLSPLQCALMPLEALKYMYIADASSLKNKGADVLITSDSDTPIKPSEKGTMSDILNREISGAHKTGRVSVSTSRLRAINIGRTAKELALWDGYPIKLRDLCNVFQLSSSLFNDVGAKTYANYEEAQRALYMDCVIPFTKFIVENPKFINFIGFEVYMDLSGIPALQESQRVKAEKAQTIQSAIIELNKEVKAGNITVDIAVKVLVTEWEYDEKEAKLLIQIPVAAPVVEPPVVAVPDVVTE